MGETPDAPAVAGAAHRGARRRRANAPTRRTRAVQVKCTAEEYLALTGLAAARQVSVPRLLVESALAVDVGQTLTERQETLGLLLRMNRLLAAVSNNVNQVARAANAGVELQADAAASIAYVRGELLPRLRLAVDRVAGR
jgi:hypothetical protein